MVETTGLGRPGAGGADQQYVTEPSNKDKKKKEERPNCCPPATTSATPAGTGRPASAAPPTAAPWAWNLVEGVNDPTESSERAIWVDGVPTEPAPVQFHGMDAIDLGGDERLDFATESRHARDENFLLFKSRYRHRFGTFSCSSAGLTLAEGFGVMEQHDAVW